MLNQLLDEKAGKHCGARRYERSPDRLDTKSGSYSRKLHTKAGEVTLQVPRLRKLPFETQIIERYKRMESSVEEALVDLYLVGVSVRRVEAFTKALWGTRVSPSKFSKLNLKVYSQIDDWRNRPIKGKHPYLYLDGIRLRRTWDGEVREVACLVSVTGIKPECILMDKGCGHLSHKKVRMAGRIAKKKERELRKPLRQRNVIEPMIGHMKSGHRLDGNYFKCKRSLSNQHPNAHYQLQSRQSVYFSFLAEINCLPLKRLNVSAAGKDSQRMGKSAATKDPLDQ